MPGVPGDGVPGDGVVFDGPVPPSPPHAAAAAVSSTPTRRTMRRREAAAPLIPRSYGRGDRLATRRGKRLALTAYQWSLTPLILCSLRRFTYRCRREGVVTNAGVDRS